MIVDAESLVAGETPPEKSTAPYSQAIIVSLDGADIAIPAAASKSDIDNVLKAVSRL